MPEAAFRTKLLAGAGLVCVSTSVGVLYKASQAASGGFAYSTASAICMAELVKLTMSSCFHVLDRTHHREGTGHVASAVASAGEQVSCRAAGHILFLGFLYMFNNQLSFFVYTLADPGTIFLFKSASTIIVAVVQFATAGKRFTGMQWKSMMLQACGMVIIQYNPCKGAGMYSPMAYLCMSLSTFITAVTAARNEFLVKNYKISLNVQNIVLYASGVALNLLAFFFAPTFNGAQRIGFFTGYDNPLAIGVVVANSCIGLAITAVYKYADAVVKCFASDVSAVSLIIISTFFFGLQSSLTMWCGVFVVVFAVHLYIDASSAATQAPEANGKSYEMAAVPAKNEDDPPASKIGKELSVCAEEGGADMDDDDCDSTEPVLSTR
mmetsp:Transcript_63634/g.179088  ORF Transcript_63634/g.179088 Transcript_63634/m.179088 type:complete len:380 (+) Transcript_63634:123-1262(+)